MPKACRLFLILLFLSLLSSPSVFAQSASASIAGQVTDASRSLIQNASIVAINNNTNVRYESKTDVHGSFVLPSLPPGEYRIEVARQGFKNIVKPDVVLHVQDSLELNFEMAVGSINETVTVQGGAPLVDTEDGLLGQTVTNRPIVNLPLNGRNVMQLAMLQPGVTEGDLTPGLFGAGSGFQIGGAKADSVTYLLDGGLNNDLLNNNQVLNPNPDAIAEFRLQTSNYSAEFGRNAGGVVSVVTKSGTNTLHGSAYDYLRNDAFNANSYFNNLNGLSRDVLKRNQFGATLGGPVMLPHVDGRNRFFWFFSYQGQRQTHRDTSTTTTFTPQELNGDFSHSNSTQDGPDPGVVSFLQTYPYFQPNSALAAQGIIDPTRIDPVSQNYVNAHLIPTSAAGKLVSSGISTNNADEFTTKLDFDVTDKDHLAFTLGTSDNPQIQAFRGANVSGYPDLEEPKRYFTTISETHTFSPSALNEFHATAQRLKLLAAFPGATLPTGPALGLGITPDHASGPTSVSFAPGLSIGFSSQGPTQYADTTYLFSDNFTLIRGRHTFKMGGGFSDYQNNTRFDFNANGTLFFDGPQASGGIGSGNAFADFLFGLPDEYTQSAEAPSNMRTKTTSLFFQDTWRTSKNLVLTLGLRYEYNTPMLDTQGRLFSLDLADVHSQRFVNAPTGVLFPGDSGAPFATSYPDKNNFAPRVGLAWDPFGDGKTSIRGGFGVYYDMLNGEALLQFNGAPPFFGSEDIFFNPLSANPAGPVNYLASPFASTGTVNTFPSTPPPSNVDFSPLLPFGAGNFFVDPHLRTPYTYQYNLTLEHQLPGSMVAELSYVGSTTHKAAAIQDANPFILGTLQRRFNALPGNSEPGGTTASQLNTGIGYADSFTNAGKADYNALQASLTKQVSQNRSFGSSYFTLGYTWGKSMDNESGFRNHSKRVPYYNPNEFWAVSDYDIAQTITFSGGWDLPLNNWGGPQTLLKGWSLYPILTWRTGLPVDISGFLSRNTTRPGPSGAGDGNLAHPNLNGNSVQTFDPRNIQQFTNPLTGSTIAGNYWLDPENFNVDGLSSSSLAAVADPSVRTYGTLGRNAIRGPGRTNLDLAIAKNTPLGEKLNMEFRVEFFNIFNHAEFMNPSTSLSSSLFGQITSTYDPRIMQLGLRFTF